MYYISILLFNSFDVCKQRKYFYISILIGIMTIEIVQPMTLYGYEDINDIMFGFIEAMIGYEIRQYLHAIKE
jgi:glycopeptide antibiotics resistance protein